MENIDKVFVFTAFNEDDWNFETKAFENYDDAIAYQSDWLRDWCDELDIDCPETLDGIKDDNKDIYRNPENDFVCVNAGCRMGEERIYSRIIETELQ